MLTVYAADFLLIGGEEKLQHTDHLVGQVAEAVNRLRVRTAALLVLRLSRARIPGLTRARAESTAAAPSWSADAAAEVRGWIYCCLPVVRRPPTQQTALTCVVFMCRSGMGSRNVFGMRSTYRSVWRTLEVWVTRPGARPGAEDSTRLGGAVGRGGAAQRKRSGARPGGSNSRRAGLRTGVAGALLGGGFVIHGCCGRARAGKVARAPVVSQL